MEFTATIQARMGSSRLPGKVLREICGKPMLLLQIERIMMSRLIDEVIVGTSLSQKDDVIENFCQQYNIKYYRGPEDDVLKRITSLIKEYKVDVHLEFCGDSPLVDPQLIDEFIGYFLKYKNESDFFSNALKTTYPPGMEITLYPAKILIETEKIIERDDPLREHVGFNITRFPDKFRLRNIEAPPWFFEPDIYLEVDTEKDFFLINEIVQHFNAQHKKYFSLSEIILFLKSKPKLKDLNKNIERRWKSLREKTKI